MTIDPRIGFWFSIVLAVLAFIGSSETQVVALFGKEHAEYVMAWTILLLGAGNAINAVLHAIPSKNTPEAEKQFMLGPKPVVLLLIGSPALMLGWLVVHMRQLIAVLFVAVLLGGCTTTGTLTDTWNVITGTKVSPSAVIVTTNAFNALEATATNYLSLPKCPVHQPICRDPRATEPIKKAVYAGRAARDNFQQFYRQHPDELGAVGLYDAFKASITTLQATLDIYNIRHAQ